MGGSSSQPHTEQPISFQETTRDDSLVEVTGPPLKSKSKPTRGHQNRTVQNEDAAWHIAWTNEEEITLCKGWVHVSESSKLDLATRAIKTSLSGNNVVPLRSDTIHLVQNGCLFHGLRSEDPNQYLKDFLKLVDSLGLDVANRKRTRLRLFYFSLRDQGSNWLECLPAGSISTWEDLTARFLAQFFPPGRTSKFRNDILMFKQHQGESLSEAWTRFKDLLQKVPHHGIDLWLQIQIFYDHVSFHLKSKIDRVAGGKLRYKNTEESWEIIENLALYNHEGWNDPRDFAKLVKAISLPRDT
ncbi:zinc finger, CCHC-type containing protein [Tanacetum coccineum]